MTLTLGGAVGTVLGVSVPAGVVGTGVVGTGVVGTGVVGTGVVGTGVVGTGVVGTGVVGTGVVGTGVVGVGVGDADRCGLGELGTCGVAATRAASALPPLAPAMCVAATGLCRGRRLGAALWLVAGGATDGVCEATWLGSVASVQLMNPIDATPVSSRAPRNGRLVLFRAGPGRRGR